jgi:hypothetical protein
LKIRINREKEGAESEGNEAKSQQSSSCKPFSAEQGQQKDDEADENAVYELAAEHVAYACKRQQR